MRVGIVGAGRIGEAVARLAIARGDAVTISNSRGVDGVADLARDIGACAGDMKEVCEFGEVLLVAIPFKAIPSLPRDRLAGKIVWDANNYYPERDGRIADLDEHRTTTSGIVARHLVRSRVVKVFNAILAKDILPDARPRGAADRRALPIAGDDAGAKDQTIRFLDDVGYDALDAGPLAESWRFERAKPAYCIPLGQGALKEALAAARRDVELPHGSWRR